MSGRSAEEVAFDCLYSMHRGQFSRETFNVIMNDPGDMGETFRKLHKAIARAVKGDRAAQEAVYRAKLLSEATHG